MTNQHDHQKDYMEQQFSSTQLTFSQVLLPEYRANPYPFYRHLQEKNPFHWDETLESWIVMRYGSVQAILNDTRFSNMLLSIETIFPPELWDKYQRVFQVLSQVACLNDVPTHNTLRNKFIQSFHLQKPREHHPQIQPLADHLIEKCIKKGQMEIMQDFAYPLVFKTMEGLLGFSLENQRQILPWGNALATLIDGCPTSLPALIEALEEALACFDFFEQRLKSIRREESFSEPSASQKNGSKNSVENLALAQCSTILASIPATACQIGNSFHALIKHPDQFNQLCLDPTQLSSAFQELLRYDTSTQTTSRQAMTDIELEGQLIRARQAVLLCLGSANHDPQQFSHPDTLDIARPRKRSLTFGEGPHVCPGILVVRLVLECFLNSLKRHSLLPTLIEAEWAVGKVIRGPKTLLVSFEV